MSDRPNILLIMADQYRHDWIGCAGAPWVRTPNIDRLAARGTRFSHCFTNAPVCVPARLGLATGLQPVRMGALDNQAYWPTSHPTYYQRLRDAGYYTGLVGKVDLAKPDPYNGLTGQRPALYTQGFTHPLECEGKMHAGKHGVSVIGPYTAFLHERNLLASFVRDYERRASEGWSLSHHDSVLPADAYEDAFIGAWSVEWLQTMPRDFPYHLFVSFVGPHDPFDPPSEFAERYRNASMPPAIPPAGPDKGRWIQSRSDQWMSRGRSEAQIAVGRRQYSAECELIDEWVGRLVQAVEERGELDRTIIIFVSDHGEMAGDHGFFDKSAAYESAWRVPLIVAGPGIAGGRVSDALIELSDLNPTTCELAGLDSQPGLDAVSFVRLLHGESDVHRESVVCQLRQFRAIRTSQWKLIENVGDRDELYDLHADPTEQINCSGERPDLVRALKRQLDARYMEGTWHR